MHPLTRAALWLLRRTAPHDPFAALLLAGGGVNPPAHLSASVSLPAAMPAHVRATAGRDAAARQLAPLLAPLLHGPLVSGPDTTRPARTQTDYPETHTYTLLYVPPESDHDDADADS